MENGVLRREITGAPEDEARSALLLFELGRLALADGNEIEAAQLLLRAYAQRPQFRPTLRLARHIYRERGDPRLLVKLFEAEAHATRDHLTRAHLFRQQARVLWTKLGDAAAARAKLEESLRLDPTELASSKLLELICTATDETKDVRARLVEQQLEMVSDETIRSGLLADLALLRFSERPQEAVELLQSACHDDPRNVSLLLLLEQLLAQTGDVERLVTVLERQAEREGLDLRWKGALLARAARLAARQGQLDRAVELFLRSSTADPYLDTLADCYDLLLDNGQLEQAVEVGERLYDLMETPRWRSALACEIGDYFNLQLGDELAATEWYRRCLTQAPDYQPALENLSTLLGRAGQVDELLEIHRADLESTTNPGARALRMFRIATLLEQYGRGDEALEMHRQALSARPSFLPSMLSLEQLLRDAGRWLDLIQLYEEQLRYERDDERAVHLLESMANTWYYQLADPGKAVDCYQRVIDQVPDQLRTVNMAARLCAEAGRWQDMATLYEREVSLAADGQRKLELLQRAGEVWEYRLFDLPRAIECYQRALDLSPEYLPALRALGRLYRQKGRWKDLITMHQAEVSVCRDPEHVVALLGTIAEVYEEELLDEGAAARVYREVLARRPGCLQATEALACIWERRGQWRDLVGLLEATVDTLADRSAQAALLCRVAELRGTRLADPEGAIEDLRHALRLAPETVPARVMLEQLLEATDADQQLVEHLSGQLEWARGPRERAAIARKLGALTEVVQRAPRKAAALYERSLEEEPDLWTIWSLARIYLQLDQPDRRATLLEQLLPLISDDKAVGELQLQIGQLKQRSGRGDVLAYFDSALRLGVGRAHALRAVEHCVRESGPRMRLPEVLAARIDGSKDQLELVCLCTELAQTEQVSGNDAGAETAYRAALEHDPKHLTALWGLGRLFEQQQRWSECMELAEREANAMISVAASVTALLRAAEIAREKLRDEDRARPIYKQVLRLRPGHGHAYDCLHAILTRRGDWAELASLIRSQISATDDQDQHARMFAELGYIYIDRLAQQQKGEACLRRVVSLDPGNLAALTTLGDIHAAREGWQEAKAMYARAVEVATLPEARAATFVRLAQVHMKLGRGDEALAAFKAASVADDRRPDVWLLRQIAEAAEAAGDQLEQANALERLAEISEDQQERIDAGKHAAFVAEELLGDSQRAIRVLQQVLVLDPLNLVAIERLAAIYGQFPDRSALLQHLQAAVTHHRAAIAAQPLNAKHYEQLARIFRWQRQFDPFYCLCCIVHQTGRLGDAEQRFVEEHHQLCATEPRLPLASGFYDQVIHPPIGIEQLRAVFHCLGPALAKVVAEQPSARGPGRLVRADNHSTVAAFQRLSGVAGKPLDFELWVTNDGRAPVEICSFGRPALIINDALSSGEVTLAQRFHLGRAFALLREPLFWLEAFTAAQCGQLIVALSLLVGVKPNAATSRGSQADPAVRELAGRLVKALPRKQRRELASLLAGDVVGAADESGIARMRSAVARAADRCGLVLACDPAVAFEERERIPLSGAHAADLFQFVASDIYFRLREQLGLAPASGPRPQGEQLEHGS